MNEVKAANSDATLLCRISSEKQKEGYSLDFQEKGGNTYATNHGLSIKRTRRVTESASKPGRKQWEEYLAYAAEGPEAHVLIPKVDRSLRNPHDLAIIMDFPKKTGKVIHFFDDGIVYHRDSPASDVLRLMMQGAVATWYSVDLSQKVKKGMDEKASQGEWPERAPRGYKNNKATKLLDVDSELAPWARRMKELSAVGLYSLDTIKDMLVAEGYPIKSHRLHRNLIERIIRNPIYAGYFEWPKGSGTLIKGKHEAIVSWDLHLAAIRGLERYNRPHYQKHNFPHAGTMRCGLCPEHRAIVFELKKKKNLIYAHCTGVRKPGLCPDSEYVRSEVIETQFLSIMRGAQINEEIAEMFLAEMAMDSGDEATVKVTQQTLIKQEIGRLDGRIKNAYRDKVDGTITEDDWRGFNKEWQAEKVRLTETARAMAESGPDSYLPTVRKALELSKHLENLYFSATADEKRELVNFICSNLFLRGKKIDYTYRKPFVLLAEGLSSAKWLRD